MKTCAYIVVVLISLVSIQQAPAQQQKAGFLARYWNSLVSDTSDISKPQFLVYPTLSYSPETKWQFGLSGLYVYYAKNDTSNRLSSINGVSFYTIENQYGLWIDHTLYSKKNKWFVPGRIRLQRFPMLYYGIGPGTSADPLAQVDATLIQIRERMMRSIFPNLYVGIHTDFQLHTALQFKPNSETAFELPAGNKGSTNIAFGLGVIYDNRENALNAREGLYTELALLRYDNAWWSDFSYTSLITDNRFYKKVNSRDVLAAQVSGQFNFGEMPFNQLALLGSESMMRGYYTGRFRDNHRLGAQLEYRFLPLPLGFTDRIGAAIFAGTGTVFNKPATLTPNDFVWAGGGGIRFLLFPKKDIYTRFDLAFTEEGKGFYIFIGEAF